MQQTPSDIRSTRLQHHVSFYMPHTVKIWGDYPTLKKHQKICAKISVLASWSHTQKIKKIVTTPFSQYPKMCHILDFKNPRINHSQGCGSEPPEFPKNPFPSSWASTLGLLLKQNLQRDLKRAYFEQFIMAFLLIWRWHHILQWICFYADPNFIQIRL